MKLQAAILDWAGTTVDYGSLAPVRALRALFKSHDVPISVEEARTHMGLLKRDHIAKTFTIPRVQAAWAERHGAIRDDSIMHELFSEFIPLQLDCLADHSTLIPGVRMAIERMRSRGMKIGSTTGYTRPMLDILSETASTQGYRPDCALCPEDVGAGRPHPWMVYENAVRMRVYPLWAMVKIGDTPSDVEEGRNAGLWTVGVVKTGNAIGLSEAEWEALTDDERHSCLLRGGSHLNAAGAHYLVDSLAEIDAILDRIEEQLGKGERP